MEMTNLVVIFIVLCTMVLIGLNIMLDINTTKISPSGDVLNTQNMSFLSSDQVALVQSQNVTFSNALNYNGTNESGASQSLARTQTILNTPDTSNAASSLIGFIDVGFTAIMNMVLIPLKFLAITDFFTSTFMILGNVGTLIVGMVSMLLLFYVAKGILFYLMKVE